MSQSDEEILAELELCPDRRNRSRLSCAECGTKDHVHLVRIPAKRKGEPSTELPYCNIHRPVLYKKSKKKGGKNGK